MLKTLDIYLYAGLYLNLNLGSGLDKHAKHWLTALFSILLVIGVFARSSKIQLSSIQLIRGASTLSIRGDTLIPFPP